MSGERVGHSIRGEQAAKIAKERALRAATTESVRDYRRARRLKSAEARARMLASIERSLFGYRMPPAAGVLLAARWSRDALDDYCTRCGATRAPYEDVTGGCGECRTRRLPFAATVRLGRYAPPLSQWVPAIKNRAWRNMGVTLGRELGDAVIEAAAADVIPFPDFVTAVPVHWLRRMLRGIDHSEVIASEVAHRLRVPFRSLLKAPLAHRQAGENRAERDRRGRFQLRRADSELEGANILLIDDVRTTGATLQDAVHALRVAHPRSIAVAVCAATDPPRRNALLSTSKHQGGLQ